MDFDGKDFLDDIYGEYTLVNWFTEDGLALLDTALDLFDTLDIGEVDVPLSAIQMLRRVE